MKVADIIMEKVLSNLESGNRPPWAMPWHGRGPHNYKSGRPYTGINALLLSLSQDGPAFLTFKQVKELGGAVKPGSEGHMVAFYGSARDKKDNERTYRFLKYYRVFGQSQIEGIDFKEKEPVEFNNTSINKILDAHRPEISHGGSRAVYFPSAHTIGMPDKESFNDERSYYLTLLHELVHWTKGAGIERNASYAEEELIAEIGSALAANMIGLNPDLDNSISYCTGWATKIRDIGGNKFLSLVSRAYKAAEFLVNPVLVT